jgi:hypothetical protein
VKRKLLKDEECLKGLLTGIEAAASEKFQEDFTNRDR